MESFTGTDEGALRTSLFDAISTASGVPVHFAIEPSAVLSLTEPLVFDADSVNASEIWLDGSGSAIFRRATAPGRRELCHRLESHGCGE